MPPQTERPTGLTKDAGYQIGVRRTLPIDQETAWNWLTSAEGVATWLGRSTDLKLTKGAPYTLANGSHGEIRVYKHRSHIRLTYQPGDWPRPSTIQLRAIPKGDKTTIAFHEEHLPDGETREVRRTHYKNALTQIKQQLTKPT